MSGIMASIKDAGPVITLIVLALALALMGWMFRRLLSQQSERDKDLKSWMSATTERMGIIGERVTTLETNDKTRQHSLSDGSNRFAQLEAADRQLQDRYLKIASSCITKEDCARCNDSQGQALAAVVTRLDRIEAHLDSNDARWMDLSQKIDARFEPLTRMLSEMVARAGGAQT